MTDSLGSARSTPDPETGSRCLQRVTMIVRDPARTKVYSVCDKHIPWAEQQFSHEVVVHVPQRDKHQGITSGCRAPKGWRQ